MEDVENGYLVDELRLNKLIMDKVTSISIDVGILAVRPAVGFSFSKEVSSSNNIFNGFSFVENLDMSIESEKFIAGNWLSTDKVKNTL